MVESPPLLKVCSVLNSAGANYLVVGGFACIKVADEVEVDVSTRAWNVTFEDAFPGKLVTNVEGVYRNGCSNR